MVVGALASGLVGCGSEADHWERIAQAQQESGGNHYEVWIVDQSNTNGTTWGGWIDIYDGHDLEDDPTTAAPADSIDLSAATTALCLAQTGARPVRPHMLFTNGGQSHTILSFVASGHVVFFDAATRTPLQCFRTSPGDAGARQAHAAIPSPDDTYVLVANQNGKLLERIDVDYGTNTFTHNLAATIDLKTCVTPNGAPCQVAGIRPDNAPICPIIESTSTFGFVTLRGGGLFVVDGTQTPMQIVGEYDSVNVHPNGCLGAQHQNTMYISSGGNVGTNLAEYDLYAFPATGYAASNPPNTPANTLVFSDDDPAHDRDGHGAVLTKHGKYLWFYDRTNGEALVFDTATNTHVNTVSFNGAVTADAAPDLGYLSPNGSYMYISMRGPVPLSGDPHVATGANPGLGVVKIKGGGKKGDLVSIRPMSNIDAGGIERADAHALVLRRTNND
jgi:hypothetical protein